MKTALMLLTLFSGSMLLTACESSPAPARYDWYKEGVSSRDTHSYKQECKYNVEMNKVSPEREGRLFISCMEKMVLDG